MPFSLNFNGGSGDIIQPNGAVHFILGNSKRGGVRVIANPTVPFSFQIPTVLQVTLVSMDIYICIYIISPTQRCRSL